MSRRPCCQLQQMLTTCHLQTQPPVFSHTDRFKTSHAFLELAGCSTAHLPGPAGVVGLSVARMQCAPVASWQPGPQRPCPWRAGAPLGAVVLRE